MPDQNPSITSNGSTKAHQVIRVPAPRAERVLEVADWRSNPFSGMNNMLRDGTAKQMGKLLFAECQGAFTVRSRRKAIVVAGTVN